MDLCRSLFYKNFSFLISHFSSQKGFTLVELLLYMGILSLLLGGLSVLFGSILDVQSDSKSNSSIDQDMRYIHAKLAYDFESNEPVIIEEPAVVGTSSTNLRINLNGEPTDNTYVVDGSGNLTLTNDEGTFNLNSADTTISNLNITRIGAGGNNDTVRVSFTITSRIQETSGVETRNFQSTFAGRNN